MLILYMVYKFYRDPTFPAGCYKLSDKFNIASLGYKAIRNLKNQKIPDTQKNLIHIQKKIVPNTKKNNILIK